MKTRNTAFSVLLLSSIAMLAAAAAAAAFEFKVGDEMGWQVPPANNSEFYDYWASINRFQIGDSLAFEYKNDSILMVEKWDYYHCNSSEPIVAFNNGKGIIKLDRPGPFYFISGFPDHCKNGQRLLVEVMSPHLMGPPPPSAPPESYADAPTSPSSHNTGASIPIIRREVVVLVAVVVGLLFSS